MPKQILIVEDELAIQTVLKELLEDAGYLIDTANDGLEGINAFHAKSYDLIMLDIMMPKIDGYAVCEMIRQESNVPIIMLTAMDEEDDQIRGFDLKADDYITKPFSLRVVLRRVEAVLRRLDSDTGTDDSDLLKYQNISLNPESYQVFVSGSEVALTRREFEILELFLKNTGHVFTRDALLNHIWGYDFYGDEKVVNIHIMNIRKKLGMDCIETVRGVGYRVDKET